MLRITNCRLSYLFISKENLMKKINVQILSFLFFVLLMSYVALCSNDLLAKSIYEIPIEELIKKKKEREEVIRKLDIIIDDNSDVIAEFLLKSSDNDGLVFNDDFLSGSGLIPYHNIPNSTEPTESSISKVLSIMSSVITVLGPIGGTIHDTNEYLIKSKPMQLSAVGWPLFDFISNALYIGHLGVDFADGDDNNTSTIIWNSVPAGTMMSVDTIIITLLAIFWGRSKYIASDPASQPLLDR